MKNGWRLRVKAQLDEPEEEGAYPTIDSVASLWAGANWFEREAWDLYGVKFRGHPDLRRILMYEEFVGHPLRKDYPKEKRQPLVRRPPDEQ
jgi:NADH-quinone oxidoreductase subunit C